MNMIHIGNLISCIFVISVLLITELRACNNLVPAELLNGCIFNPLMIVSPNLGYSIHRENCYTTVDKSIFFEQPFVYFEKANEAKFYTIIMVDPDAPNLSPDEFWLLWIVANIPGYIMKQGVGYSAGDTIIAYEGPAPPAFSGPHRYMILAYEQENIFFDFPIPEYRSRFNIMDWFISFGAEAILRGPVSSIGFISEF